MIKIIKKKGVRKSADEVTKGIKKLLGSFPLLNRNIEPINNTINMLTNRRIIVINKTMMIKKGLMILMSV